MAIGKPRTIQCVSKPNSITIYAVTINVPLILKSSSNLFMAAWVTNKVGDHYQIYEVLNCY